MYVKKIDDEKKAASLIMEKAEYDSMTNVLNKGTKVLTQLASFLKQVFFYTDSYQS